MRRVELGNRGRREGELVDALSDHQLPDKLQIIEEFKDR